MASDKKAYPEIGNAALLEEFYQQYKKDPSTLSPSWLNYFKQIDSQFGFQQVIESFPANDEFRIAHLIDAYRIHGHFLANVNPIALKHPTEPAQLHLVNLGFTSEDLAKPFPTHGLLSQDKAPLSSIIQKLRSIYSERIGVEYFELADLQIRDWIQQRLEQSSSDQEITDSQKKLILDSLNKAELFESFLHTKYVGQKRFSIEGGETLVPMLTAMMDKIAESGGSEVVLGMAHRGRLNVLAHILNKSYMEIFSEFDEDYIPESFYGTGDVKYHKGYVSEQVMTHLGKNVKVTLTPNPSHLESVDAVVEGQVRAKQFIQNDENDRQKVIPVLIHGDAALSGQGVVYETIQMCHLSHYETGGTLHFVINNQIGFTTWPKDSRSTHYCTAIAHAFDAPVFHVNAEDPESCIWVTLLACEIRQRFHCDVFIDLNCYRKYGHNESDEPAFTQPLEYQLIKGKKSIRDLYVEKLIKEGVCTNQQVNTQEELLKKNFQEIYAKVQAKSKKSQYIDFMTIPNNSELFKPFESGVSANILESLTQQFCTVPDGFQLHPKLDNLLKDRLSMASGNKLVDWGMGETLAYATLLSADKSIRIAGQDSCRGTFSHRHAMWIDQKEEVPFFPLAHLKNGHGNFEIVNSLLSEMAALGFEYGYSVALLEGLTIWEAQFGDFCNGAQVIIDQYIASGEQKWGQQSNLTLFLPHGYEGQGPEHSSGRLERFLTLCGHDNMQVVNPTTPAQLFHLLRRQCLRTLRKPLIVFTPKGLLRHPACVNPVEDFTKGAFQEILDDPKKPLLSKRLVICTGRVYYDLIQERDKHADAELAILRIEQLYPFNQNGLKELIDRYKEVNQYLWVQEEPKNMGAWHFIRSYLEAILNKKVPLRYVGRETSASPATGSHLHHKQEHTNILKQVFEI